MTQATPTVPSYPSYAPPLQLDRIALGENMAYATPAPPPNPFPVSWMELSMQGRALTISAIIEGQEVILIVQNPVYLAQVITEGMRLATETYYNQLWVSTALQPTLNNPLPQMPFYHPPSWDMPLINPLQPQIVWEPAFETQQQMNEHAMNLWNPQYHMMEQHSHYQPFGHAPTGESSNT